MAVFHGRMYLLGHSHMTIEADRELLKSIRVPYAVIAECFGVTPQRVRMWAVEGIPDERRQDVLDMAEAYRQVREETTKKIQGHRNEHRNEPVAAG